MSTFFFIQKKHDYGHKIKVLHCIALKYRHYTVVYSKLGIIRKIKTERESYFWETLFANNPLKHENDTRSVGSM